MRPGRHPSHRSLAWTDDRDLRRPARDPSRGARALRPQINASGGNAGPCHVQSYTMGTLLRHGSAEQKRRYLRRIAVVAGGERVPRHARRIRLRPGVRRRAEIPRDTALLGRPHLEPSRPRVSRRARARAAALVLNGADRTAGAARANGERASLLLREAATERGLRLPRPAHLAGMDRRSRAPLCASNRRRGLDRAQSPALGTPDTVPRVIVRLARRWGATRQRLARPCRPPTPSSGR